MPNQFIGDIWGTDLPADYWDATKTFNEESQKSAAFGFSFDATQGCERDHRLHERC